MNEVFDRMDRRFTESHRCMSQYSGSNKEGTLVILAARVDMHVDGSLDPPATAISGPAINEPSETSEMKYPSYRAIEWSKE
jgi:hypothetical protein